MTIDPAIQALASANEASIIPKRLQARRIITAVEIAAGETE